jgi:hypothetical protein
MTNVLSGSQTAINQFLHTRRAISSAAVLSHPAPASERSDHSPTPPSPPATPNPRGAVAALRARYACFPAESETAPDQSPIRRRYFLSKVALEAHALGAPEACDDTPLDLGCRTFRQFRTFVGISFASDRGEETKRSRSTGIDCNKGQKLSSLRFPDG